MKKIDVKKRILKILLYKAIPLWMIFVLMLETSALVGLAEYYIMKKNFNEKLLTLAKSTKNPEELMLILKQQVIPQEGYTLGVTWKNIGEELLNSGVIDKKKYEELFSQDPTAEENLKYMKYLVTSSNEHMKINEINSRFMVNTLWALGLVNKSSILTEGQMQIYSEGDIMGFASTGGWSLGSKSTIDLYASQEIVSLSEEQQKLVEEIAANIYRPCCGNSTLLPDCNHGMAALGYIELAVNQGVSKEQIYKDLLVLNSYWFPQEYVLLAAHMEKKDITWEKIDPKTALSEQYSSAQGASEVRQSIQAFPGLQNQGGGCGA